MIGGEHDDPDRQMFGVKYRDLFDMEKQDPVDNEKKAKEVIDNMIAKSNVLVNGE